MEVDGELETLLSAESDHDFAFKLQMEEAMKVSVSVQPSSSSSSSKLQFEFDLLKDDVSDANIALLLAEENERFERKNTDNYLHKPYGEGSSSTAPTINGESFKLCWKGLVSEKTVGGVKKMLVGLGVAIFGSSNEIVIFELRKPLVGAETIGEIADMRALIEGLNAADTLGLKRITIFCDENSLYQYVIRVQFKFSALFIPVCLAYSSDLADKEEDCYIFKEVVCFTFSYFSQ